MSAVLRVARAIAAAVLVAVVVLLAVGAVASVLQARTDRVIEGAKLEGVDVGGLDSTELSAVGEELRAKREDAAVAVRGTRDEVEATRREFGVTYDAAAGVGRVWRLGRRDPVRSLWDHAQVIAGRTIHARVPEDIDEDTLESRSRQMAEELTTLPRPAGVEFHDDPEPPEPDDPASRAEPIEPAPGEEVDADELHARVTSRLAETRGPVAIDAPSELVDPAADERDLDAVLPDARTAVSEPIWLTNPADGADLRLGTSELAAVLEVHLEEDAEPGSRLRLVADPDTLEEVLGETRIADTAADPVEATFEIVDGEPHIRGGTAGYRFDAEDVATQVREVATRTDDRTEELAGPRPQPGFTRDEAQNLAIEEEVSSFTTEHACCPPRVTNIQLGADILDGAIVRPGETFSLDERLGPRTRARGFVDAGVIIDGEFEDAVGGGLSQLATTFFNAVFFSGVRIIEHQPHSYYIDRYPMGRESTIVRGVIDVAFENDSPYGILIATTYTDTSVTVTFYSTQWAEVEAWSSDPYNVEPGQERDGFDIDYGRIVTYPDGATHEDAWFHRYQPQDEP